MIYGVKKVGMIRMPTTNQTASVRAKTPTFSNNSMPSKLFLTVIEESNC